jgi:hypothetical protein
VFAYNTYLGITRAISPSLFFGLNFDPNNQPNENGSGQQKGQLLRAVYAVQNTYDLNSSGQKRGRYLESDHNRYEI